ncbi:hypothetical protein ACOYW6_08695 [Parablastomonas sp. CN1-191]|uniref:hypothetical protein n=1 Tax=Parablastomonas sp. CN1-191 TaxID=3400908 RepID=UPI003BF7A90A
MTGTIILDRGATALVIDDNLLTAWALEDSLRDIGFGEVIVAATAAAAAQVTAVRAPTIIVCDLDLGPLSEGGLAALVALDPAGTIPTLVYSAHSGPDIDRALAAVRPHALRLGKPASDAALTAAIMQLVALKSSAPPARPAAAEPAARPAVGGRDSRGPHDRQRSDNHQPDP